MPQAAHPPGAAWALLPQWGDEWLGGRLRIVLPSARCSASATYTSELGASETLFSISEGVGVYQARRARTASSE
jgi:hypothetical protein